LAGGSPGEEVSLEGGGTCTGEWEKLREGRHQFNGKTNTKMDPTRRLLHGRMTQTSKASDARNLPDEPSTKPSIYKSLLSYETSSKS